MDSENKKLDPAQILAGIDQESEQAHQALSPNQRLLYALWGSTWMIGFLAFYAAFVPVDDPLISRWVAAGITAFALIFSIVFSAVHSAKRASGTRGPSMVQGAIYGNCFFLSFLFVGLLGWRLAAAGLSAMGLLSYVVAACALVVGALCVTGALVWNDRTQLIFGGWVLVVGLLSLALPAPHNLLAGGLGGAGLIILGILHGAGQRAFTGVVVSGDD